MNKNLKFIGFSRKDKKMKPVGIINFSENSFILEGEHKEYKLNGTKLYPFTRLEDKYGNPIHEGHYVIGQRGWNENDGYLKKKYPKRINVIFKVVYYEGKYELEEIKPTEEHKDFYEEINYRYTASLRPIYSNSGGYSKFKKKNAHVKPGITVPKVEIIGHSAIDKKKFES